MKIGILSDTHDDTAAMRHALRLLRSLGAGHVLHCGDIGRHALAALSRFCVQEKVEAHAAIGNCDSFLADFRFAPAPPHITLGLFLGFTLDEKKCALLHGHTPAQLEMIIQSGEYDYVFSGHTHHPLDECHGKTRHINPGAVTSPRNAPASVALLDTADSALDFLLLG